MFLSVSEIVREAVRRHCEMLTTDRLSDRLSDVVGAVSSGQGQAGGRGQSDSRGQSRKTGRQFANLVGGKHNNRKKRGDQKGRSK
jgi:hypothetical protein